VEIADLRAENALLDRRIEDLKSNDVAIEREIRRQLEMIEPSEVIFLFESETTASAHP
jgi:cell division protein FtsB